MLTNRSNHNIFICFYVFGHSLCWSEKTFCLEDGGILYNGRMKIIIIIIIIMILIIIIIKIIIIIIIIIIKDTYIARYPRIAQSAVQ